MSRLAWSVLSVGSISWMLVPAGILFAGGGFIGGVCCLGIFAAGVAYTRAAAPWKHPETPFWKIYAGLLVFILGGAAAIIVLWFPSRLDGLGPVSPLCVLPLLLPLILGGGRRWGDGEGSGRP
jgi:hypothetical protein